MSASSDLYDSEAWAPRSRRPVPGPELDLLSGALNAHDWRAPCAPILFREPELPTGAPDVVAVFLRNPAVLFNRERLALREPHLRILHHLFSERRPSTQQLATSLSLDTARLTRLLGDLERAELLRRKADRVYARPLADAFVARRIVAVEAKISNWRRAIHQAFANTWFASHSYVLLPEARWGPSVRDAAAQHGVGVIVFDGNRTSIRLRAAARRLPLSYGSWLVNEWTVRLAGRPAEP